MPGPNATTRRGADAAPQTGHRADIQLLRALAVMAVVLNHLFPNRLTGGYLGVDIFFVISGFLITAHLLSELERDGQISLARFWARRARRLLPASLTVLAVCAIATVAWLPQTRWAQVMSEILASALYFQNWELAASAQDYFTSAQTASPVTHFWSLSVEEQFYLLWPLLVLGTWWLAARRTDRLAHRQVLALALGTLGVASLALAAWAVETHPDAGYFITPARVWEFAAGGVLAATSRGAGGGRPRWVVAVGWSLMIGSIWLFGDSSGVPGPLTVLPVAGCVLVLWAGNGGAGRPVPRWQAAPVWVGDTSYSVYLWHWPLIVFAPYVLDRPMTPLLGLAVLALTLVLAQLSTTLVEDPVRRAQALTSRPAAITLAGAALAMAAVAGTAAYVPTTVAGDLQAVQEDIEDLVVGGGPCVGAAAAATGGSCPDSHELTLAGAPLLTIVNSPYEPAWGTTCQVAPEDPRPAPCEFGVSEDDAVEHLALVGDSHAGHWASVLDTVARKRDWNVEMQVKSSCLPTSGDVHASWATEPMIASCRQWSQDVRTALADDPDLDVIVMSGIARDYASVGPAGVVEQLRGLWADWVAAGKHVVVLADPPYLGRGPLPECLASASTTRDPCAARADVVRTTDPLVAAAAGEEGVTLVDLTDLICDERRCHAVVGGIPVYGDQNHLLQYFARTMAPQLAERLAEVPGLGGRQGR